MLTYDILVIYNDFDTGYPLSIVKILHGLPIIHSQDYTFRGYLLSIVKRETKSEKKNKESDIKISNLKRFENANLKTQFIF